MIEIALAALLLVQEPPSDEKIKQLIDQLGADYEDERVAARKELEKVGAPAEPHLVDALTKEDYRIRKGCLELLTILKSQKAVERASGIFRSATEEKTVRESAFSYLRVTGKPAEDVMIEALDSAETGWRREALLHLTEIKSEKCAEKVAALYDKETDKALKETAFQCLQNVGKPAQPFLLKLLGSQDATVRKGALAGLKKIGATGDEIFEPVSKLFLIESDPQTLAEATEVLKTGGEKSIPIYLEGLRSAQEIVRVESINGLRTLKPDSALEPLAKLFETDGSEKVREDAAAAVEQYGAKAEDALVRAFDNANAKVRWRALVGLQTIKAEKPYARIAELFRNDKDPDVHKKAFDYLKAMGARAEKELLIALKDEMKEIREQAIDALGGAKCEAAIEPLLDLVTDLDENIRTRAMGALCRIGPKAIEAAKAAAEAKKIKPKARDLIIAMYHQEEVEGILLKLMSKEGGTGYYDGQFADLDKFGRERAMPVLVKIATDREHKLRVETANQQQMKELAIMAVGVLGGADQATALEEAMKANAPVAEEHEEFVISLYRLGRKGPYEALLKQVTKDVEAELKKDHKGEAYGMLFTAGKLQARVGERAPALASYERLAKVLEEHKQTREEIYADSLYNIACLLALMGEKTRAVEALGRAVDAGFKDRSWIEMDRDLASIRDDAGYKALMADAKRFERKLPD